MQFILFFGVLVRFVEDGPVEEDRAAAVVFPSRASPVYAPFFGNLAPFRLVAGKPDILQPRLENSAARTWCR